MAGKRIRMRKIKEVLQLRLKAGLSVRQISASTKISVGAIQKLLARAEALQLTWPSPAELDETRLAAMLYPGADAAVSQRYQILDWASVHQQLKRKVSIDDRLVLTIRMPPLRRNCSPYPFFERNRTSCPAIPTPTAFLPLRHNLRSVELTSQYAGRPRQHRP